MNRTRIFIALVILSTVLISCDGEGGDAYFFEDEVEEFEEEVPEAIQVPEGVEIQEASGGETSAIESSTDIDTDTIPDYQDKEPEANTVKDLIEYVLTDGELDTQKVKASIINTMMYVSKQSLRPAFACEYIAYFGCNIMLPLPKNSISTDLYIPMDMGGKRYHFILFNYRGYVSGKNYIVECKRDDFSYKELFIFYPAGETRTQSSLLIAVADEYLKDVQTMMNINWRVGEEDAEFKDYGVIQYALNKQVPN